MAQLHIKATIPDLYMGGHYYRRIYLVTHTMF